jgi:phosphoribosyl-ATP pyrophosphohydrolase/phosphoribosyl-AMP cyclohydrolase
MIMGASDQVQVVLDEQGLVPAICQDVTTGKVLMLAYINPDSLSRTLEGGEVVFYSRSREELWHKGATSGSYLRVESAHVDCDGDVLLFQVHADGPACHTGETSCFFTELETNPEFVHAEKGPGILQELFQVIRQRQQERPEGSYTTSLFEAGTSRIAQKVAEEASEVAIAAASGDTASVPAEVADLLYHTLVLMADTGVTPEEVWQELRRRRQG